MYAFGSLSLVELMQTYISDLLANNNKKLSKKDKKKLFNKNTHWLNQHLKQLNHVISEKEKMNLQQKRIA